MKSFHFLFHSIIYYIAWFICITKAARGDAWLSSLIVIISILLQICWQCKIQHTTHGLWYLIGLIFCISTLIDSLLIFNGIIVFTANPFAPYATSPWMITLWISFAITLYATWYRLFNHLILLGLLSFSGFSLAFIIGEKMGAVSFPYGSKTCFLIGSIWLIMIPCTIFYYKKIMGLK